MLQNFTLIDIVGSVEASLLLTLILFVPGYVIGWLSNGFSFRQQRFLIQSLISTPLAVAVLPIVVYFLGRYRAILWLLFAGIWVAFVLIIRPKLAGWWGGISILPSAIKWAAAIVIGWTIIAIASLVDLQLGHRLYFSVPAFDYSLRVALTAAASRTIPPGNPFFASAPPVLLRYHYFWMLICSLVPHLGSIGSRQAMFGGTVWAGIALMSLIGVALKFFLNVTERLGPKLLIGCGLLLVTGLDILPTIFLYFWRHTVYPDMEWWNEQLTSWPDALLWCPHHVMSLVACIVGFLLIRHPASTKFHRVGSLLLAGMSFASAFGLSVLVSFTFAVFIAFWLPYAALRRWWDDVAALLASGAVALILALPFLRSMFGPAIDGFSGEGRFFAVWIRPFPLGMIIVGSLTKLRGMALGLLAVPFLPLNYFLELGFFAVIAVLRFRSTRRDSATPTRGEATAWMMVAVTFLIGSFLRSTSIQSNDLAWRCFLLAQFVLLLWGTCAVDEWWSKWRHHGWGNSTVRFATLLLALGIVGTIYQLCMLRIYPLLLDNGKVTALESATWMPQDGQLGERTYALRSVYDRLSLDLPQRAIVQFNAEGASYVPHGLYLLRDAAVGLPLCGAVFGGNASQCRKRTEILQPLFESPTIAQSARLDAICREYGISTMLVDDQDPVWKQHDSWAWTRTPILANDHARAFSCGDSEQHVKLALEKKQ